tara:strand:- start:388 stop:1047 length:660 start_codon:yes stop_codon:yes gene_type:complete
MRKKIFFAFFLLILLSTYNIKLSTGPESRFTIKKIYIENNSILDEKKLKEKLSFLYETNLFFLKTRNLKTKLQEIEFIDSYEIKKIYPDKIKIKIFEKEPIAILQYKKKKEYFTNKGDAIKFTKLKKFSNLPLVFGEVKNFKIFYNSLKNIDFPIEEIKIFYFFESQRWDLVTNYNQTIKLPIKDYEKSLKNYLNIKEKENFKKYKTFDYRINDQLILK